MKCLNPFFFKERNIYIQNKHVQITFHQGVWSKRNLDFVILCQAHRENVCLTHGGVFVNVWHMFTNFFLLFMCVCACARARSHKAWVFPRCVRGPAETRMALADGSLNASFTDPLQMKLCSTINSKSVAKNPFTVSKLVNWPWKAKPKTLPKQPLSIPMLTHFAKQERPAEAPLQIGLGI